MSLGVSGQSVAGMIEYGLGSTHCWASLAGQKSQAGAFGPTLLKGGPITTVCTGPLEMTVPANACVPLQQDLSGKAALVDRGDWAFKTKVLYVQAAGAIAAVITHTY